MELIYSMLLLCSWLIPLHLLPWAGWHQEVAGFFLVLVLGWHAFALARQSKDLRIPRSAWFFALLGLVVVVQWVGGQIIFGGDALVLGFYLVLIAICFCVGFAATRMLDGSARALHGLAQITLVGALLSILVALVQVFDVWETLPMVNRMWLPRRPGANLGQPNHLATLLLMGVASLAFLYESKKCGKALSILLFALLVFGLALTESRTGILGFFCMALWWWMRRSTVALTVTPIVIFLALTGLFALLWAWPIFIAFVMAGGNLEGVPIASVDTAAGARLVVWPQLIEAVLQRPWFGWGLRQVSMAHNAVLHSYAHGEPFTYAHNVVLDLAVGIGLPLTGLLVAAVAYWLWSRAQGVKHLAAWYCLAFALPLGLHSMLEFPFAYAYLVAPTMFALGVLEGILVPQRTFKLAHTVAASVLSLATVLMLWSAVEYVAIEEDFRVARFEAQHIGTTPKDYVRPQVILLTQLGALLNVSRIVPAPHMAPERVELARKVALRFPWTATQNRYALSLALNGNPEEAVRQLKVMRAMHGEGAYRAIKANWAELADTRYPQLQALSLP